MIAPLSIAAIDAASDAEILTAYVAEGETEAGARALLAALRGPVPEGCFVD